MDKGMMQSEPIGASFDPPVALNRLRKAVGMVAVVVLLLSSIALKVSEGEAHLVTRFGSPDRLIETAGLHWKFPYPVEKNVVIDMRKRTLQTRHTEMLTKDRKNIILLSYASWSIQDPLRFYQSVGSYEAAEEKLDGLITNAKIGILGQYDLSALASTNPDDLKVDLIEEALLDEVVVLAKEQYGITLHTVGFSRLSLPKANISAVFTQMRAERKQYASQFQAEGDEQAAQIRAETDLTVAEIRAQGLEEAAKIRGSAEAEAAKVYAEAHAKAPELYRFVRSLDTLDSVLGTRSSVILRTDSAPFELLTSSGKQ
ncbi:MAG: protease modulator HflC [Myxococcota bacterium]